ncbi:hypothetical protein SH449x_001912 [Pirellulaceae bacterium SH449]
MMQCTMATSSGAKISTREMRAIITSDDLGTSNRVDFAGDESGNDD